MELKFGCEMQRGNVYKVLSNASEDYCLCIDSVHRCVDIESTDTFIILGRLIRLSDVLLAFGDKRYEEIEESRDMGITNQDLLLDNWNLK